MALLLIEGFDHISAAQLAAKGWVEANGVSSAMNTGRLAGQALGLNSGNANPRLATKTLPSTYSEVFCGVAVKTVTAARTGQNVISLINGGTIVVQVRLLTVGPNTVWAVYNSAATLLAQGTSNYLNNNWVYLELRVVVSATVGVVELRVNGVSEVTATGLNTGSTNIASIRLASFSTNADRIDFDDIYVLDTSGAAPRNTFLGDCRVDTIRPSTNGNSAQWTPLSSTLASNVDDGSSYDSDTTYNSTSGVGNKDTFDMAALASSSGTCYGVQSNLVVRKDDVAAHTVCAVTRQGGTDYDGATGAALTTSYVIQSELYQQDPTGTNWTLATVNADEFGYKMVS